MSSLRLPTPPPQSQREHRTNTAATYGPRKSTRVRVAPVRYTDGEPLSQQPQQLDVRAFTGVIVVPKDSRVETATRKRKRTPVVTAAAAVTIDDDTTTTTTTHTSSQSLLPSQHTHSITDTTPFTDAVAVRDVAQPQGSYIMHRVREAQLKQTPTLHNVVVDLTEEEEEEEEEDNEHWDTYSPMPRPEFSSARDDGRGRIGFLVTPRAFVRATQQQPDSRDTFRLQRLFEESYLESMRESMALTLRIIQASSSETALAKAAILMSDTNVHTSTLEKGIDKYEECSICLENYDASQEVSFIRNCTHRFHKTCLSDWFSKGRSIHCPVCRTSVL